MLPSEVRKKVTFFSEKTNGLCFGIQSKQKQFICLDSYIHTAQKRTFEFFVWDEIGIKEKKNEASWPTYFLTTFFCSNRASTRIFLR
jgi:hypothetical protein